MTKFEPEYRNFELKPNIQQLSTTSQFTIEELFKPLETAGIEMTTAHDFTMIDPIINRNY